MFTKKRKKGVTLFELLGAVALSGVVAALLASIMVFVGNSSKLITNNANITKESSDCSILILNKVNGITVNNATVGKYSIDQSATFSSDKQYVYDEKTGDFTQVGPSDSRWKGPKSISFKIDSATNTLQCIEVNESNSQVVTSVDFNGASIDPENSYIEISESNSYTYSLEIRIDYRTRKTESYKSYYTSLYVNRVK